MNVLEKENSPNQKEGIAMKLADREALIRSDILEVITKALEDHYDTDVLPTGAGEVAIPVLDADGNEAWGVVKISTPRGTRGVDGGYTPYDGYMQHSMYVAELDARAAKKVAREAKKAADEAERERKKAEREARKKAQAQAKAKSAE